MCRIGEDWPFFTDPAWLHSLSRDRRVSPEWKGAATSAQSVRGLALGLIEKRWGDKPIVVRNDFRMVGKVMEWRYERAVTPRASDMGITVLR